MQDEKERCTELDYCDLDPTKICDNCCKCIDSGKDYEDFQIELTDSISTLDEIMELPFDDDLFDDDDYDDEGIVRFKDSDQLSRTIENSPETLTAVKSCPTKALICEV